jgi:hypothetical protein
MEPIYWQDERKIVGLIPNFESGVIVRTDIQVVVQLDQDRRVKTIETQYFPI